MPVIMSALNSLNFRVFLQNSQWRLCFRLLTTQGSTVGDKPVAKILPDEEEFRVLDLGNNPVQKFLTNRRRTQARRGALPIRADKMPIDQDWPSVWPTARVFHPASVPLPLFQGHVKGGKRAKPGKFGNAELMKIPNFLHLTPPAIEKHCEALKKFCSQWPKELETEEQMKQHFPVELISSDYCHSSPTIRDPRARIVTLQVKLDSLPLDEHAKDKLLRLIKERYDSKTNTISLVAERCPLRLQNRDYAMYLLSVLISESWKTEPWESSKSESDMEKYVWEGSPSQLGLKRLGKESLEDVKDYSEAVVKLHNDGEDPDTVSQYKQAVKALLGRK